MRSTREHFKTRFLGKDSAGEYRHMMQAMLRRADLNAFKMRNNIPIAEWEGHYTGELLEWVEAVQTQNDKLRLERVRTSC